MKVIILVLLLVLSACSYHETKNNQNLKMAMAYGTIKELNKVVSAKDKDLLIRLYQVPSIGMNCYIETHGVCQYKYYISVSTFDESPEVNVFELATFGEVTNIEWLSEERYDYVEIEITLNKYTNEALKNNNSLVNKETKVLLKIDINNVVEKVLY